MSQEDRAAELEQENSLLRNALEWYAVQLCEFGRDFEGCGKMPSDDCAGCMARAALKQNERPL